MLHDMAQIQKYLMNSNQNTCQTNVFVYISYIHVNELSKKTTMLWQINKQNIHQ